jgi:hypothetical protein
MKSSAGGTFGALVFAAIFFTAGCVTSSPQGKRAGVSKDEIIAKLSCFTDYASIPYKDLGHAYSLRRLPVSAVKPNAYGDWQTQCPITLVSSKSTSTSCKSGSVLYDGNSDMPQSPGRQENIMFITDTGSRTNHVTIFNPIGKKMIVDTDLDNTTPPYAKGAFKDAGGKPHTIFIYFLNLNPTAGADLTKVYIVEDFDDTDTNCASERPDYAGVTYPCGDPSQPQCPVIYFPTEDGVGVGNEHKP